MFLVVVARHKSAAGGHYEFRAWLMARRRSSIVDRLQALKHLNLPPIEIQVASEKESCKRGKNDVLRIPFPDPETCRVQDGGAYLSIFSPASSREFVRPPRGCDLSKGASKSLSLGRC